MKIQHCLVLVAISAMPGAPQPKNADAALGAARHLEEAEGNYPGAIEAYQKFLARYGQDRALSAKALVRMGQCYEKLGDAEARKAYQRVVREFGEQKDPAAVARARLAALDRVGGLRQPSGITLRKVWTQVDVEGSPSPDGRYHSFTDWETGDLAVRDLETGENRRLTNKGRWEDSPEYAETSVISEDGKQIAYGWSDREDHYELRVIGMDGSKPRTVYRDKEYGSYIEPYQWTADGKQILTALQGKRDETQIALVPAAGGPARVLKTLPKYPWHISLSPDGRYLAYDVPVGADSRERDIYLFPLDGGPEVPLVRQPFDDYGPVWMPDGKRVLFISDRTGTSSLWAVNVVDGKPEGVPRLVKDGVGRVIRPNGFTRQGAFYYSTRTSMADLYVAEFDPVEGRMLRHPAPVAVRFVGTNSAPSWSPDGSRLAYYSQRGSPQEAPTLVILAVGSGQARDLPVRLNHAGLDLHWFPDGKSILVTAWDSPERHQVAFYRVDVETGDYRLVRESPGSGPRGAELSPDGKMLFFWTGGDAKARGGVIAREIDTGREREIARVPYPGGGNGWTQLAASPDGKLLAFRSPPDDKWTALRLVPASGGEVRELFRFRQSEAFGNGTEKLGWTPDGRNLLFLRRTGKDGIPEIWRISVAGGEPQRAGLSMEGMGRFALHPDGRRFAFEVGSLAGPPNELWVLENFLGGAATQSVQAK